MVSPEQFPVKVADPLLVQAEKIFSQRKTRAQVIDPDLLGEPGWDILLHAFISQRKGIACRMNDAALAIGLSLATTKRWADLLEKRGLLVRRDDVFAISDEAESKLSTMFRAQIKEIIDEIAAYQRLTEVSNRQKL